MRMRAPKNTHSPVSADGKTYEIVDGRITVPDESVADLERRGFTQDPVVPAKGPRVRGAVA